MKTSNIAIMAVAAVAAFVLAGGAFAAKTKSGEAAAVLKIENAKTFGTLTKAPVTFAHTKHNVEYKVACDKCHHVFKDKKQEWKEGDRVQKCAECHKSPKENDGEMLSLYNAYHKNCRDCHKDMKKGPTKCDECHPKK
jgi:hypothetical protein